MSKLNEREILSRLANDDTWEMTPHDLEELLSAELDKPADEIDADLVEEILDTLGVDEPDPKRKKADWPLVKRHLPRRQAKSCWPRRLLRISATAAAIAIVMLTTLRDAEAFRWTLIQKLLKPVAETFGIFEDDQGGLTPQPTDMPQYSVSDTPSTTVTFAALDDVPEMHEGYRIRPRWLPEGYAFADGSHFSSVDIDIYTLDFSKDNSLFSLFIHILPSIDSVFSYEFERNLEVPIEKTVGQHTITFYNNTDDIQQSAFWVHENAHYILTGEITVENIMQLIEHME